MIQELTVALEAILAELRAIRVLLEGGQGPAPGELPVAAEDLPTWLLTDSAVSRLEQAIEVEQRVRGQAYGG